MFEFTFVVVKTFNWQNVVFDIFDFSFDLSWVQLVILAELLVKHLDADRMQEEVLAGWTLVEVIEVFVVLFN